MMKDNGNYFEDLNKLFAKAYEEENIVIDEGSKHRVRENLAYKINNIKLHGWESPISLFLKDKLRFAPVVLPLLLIGVFTTFAAVGYIDVPFIGGDKETDTEINESQDIAMNTVRDTQTPKRDEGQLIMADLLQEEFEEDVVEIEEVGLEKETFVSSRNLSENEIPPELLILDINTMGETQYVFEPNKESQPPVEDEPKTEPQTKDDKSMLAFGEDIKTGGGLDLSFFTNKETSDSSVVEEESVSNLPTDDKPKTDTSEAESQPSNKTVESVVLTSESTNDLEDEKALTDDSTQDQASDSQDQNPPADTTEDIQDSTPPSDDSDSSGGDSTDDSKPDDDPEAYLVAYLIPQGKELEALSFSNTEVEKLVLNRDVDKVTIEYLEAEKIKVTIENNGKFEYYTFVKDGFDWKEFDPNAAVNVIETIPLTLSPQPLELSPQIEASSVLTETFKEEFTRYNIFK